MDDPDPESVSEPTPDGRPAAGTVGVEEIRTHLEELKETVNAPEERREVSHAIHLLDTLAGDSVRKGIVKFTRRDIAEALVGSVLISLPMLVEDGVFTIADHFVAAPFFLVINAVFVVVMTTGLLYYADFRNVTVHRPIFGIVPRRLTAVLLVSFLTAAFAMTLWGRLEGWADPTVALARISVVWTAAAFGAALGDILPGESAGRDINDELGEFGERLGIGDEEGRF